MVKKSRQKFEYLEKEKSFYNEMKSILSFLKGFFIEANTTIFVEVESLTLIISNIFQNRYFQLYCKQKMVFFQNNYERYF